MEVLDAAAMPKPAGGVIARFEAVALR